MKVLQNRRLVGFLKRTDCWCVFSWSMCNQNGHFIQCIQSRVFKVVMANTNQNYCSKGDSRTRYSVPTKTAR